ncbi:MAG: YlxM family DNA-binding protein [Halanaerobiaceae bacterium]
MRLTLLFDYYGNLLTKKQQKIMKLYFFYDLSLAEIAEKIDISRQGVYDHLQRAEKMLNEYEKKMKLVQKHEQIKAQLDDFAQDIDEIIADQKQQEKLQERIDKLREIL